MHIIEESKTSTTEIHPALATQVHQELGENVFLCYQCLKCTSGCPVSDYFDWQPNQIMRAVQLGQEDIALDSETIWLCASCQTCTTRCPQGLNIAGIMDFLCQESTARKLDSRVPEVRKFNQAFMREVRIWGRLYELGLMAELKLRTGKITDDLDLAAKIILRNKISFTPSIGCPPKNVKPHKKAGSAVAYYPGCSLHSTSPEYNISTKAVCQALEIEIVEPKGWVCCGSSPAHRHDPEEALRLPIENLALLENYGFSEVTMPCAACFNRHKAAQYEANHHAEKLADTHQNISNPFQGTIQVSTILDFFLEHIGTQGIKQRVRKPLNNLRIVPYYGCLLTRPPEVTESTHPENPIEMDVILTSLGAEVIDWSYKTSCCGASHSLSRPDIVLDLSGQLIQHAKDVGADAIAVACPLCHTNLDARQTQMHLAEPLPVLFITQLMAVAMGLGEKETALKKNLIDPRPLLTEKKLI
jgi:heterodisulfide reductase subunit B